jgi:hypothetical protein
MSLYTLANTVPNYGTISISAPGGSNGTWSTNPILSTNHSGLQVTGDAEFSGQVKINGQDIGKTLESIQDRLAILVPDPKLLDKYEALKQAYEHYKVLEALCIDATDSKR